MPLPAQYLKIANIPSLPDRYGNKQDTAGRFCSGLAKLTCVQSLTKRVQREALFAVPSMQ